MLKFLKKNGYYIMLAVCLICIGTMIAVAVNANNKVSELQKPSPKPSISAKPSPSPSVSTPVDNKPVDNLPTEFKLPVANATIGLDYTVESFVFSETLGQWQTHAGIDFVTTESADVVAIADGTVSSVITDDILNGGTVVVDHGNGLKSIYMSLSSEIPVAVGDKLSAGDKLGVTSMSAYSEFKEGTHLHLEMTMNGENVNPNDYLGGNK